MICHSRRDHVRRGKLKLRYPRIALLHHKLNTHDIVKNDCVNKLNLESRENINYDRMKRNSVTTKRSCAIVNFASVFLTIVSCILDGKLLELLACGIWKPIYPVFLFEMCARI